MLNTTPDDVEIEDRVRFHYQWVLDLTKLMLCQLQPKVGVEVEDELDNAILLFLIVHNTLLFNDYHLCYSRDTHALIKV